MIISRDKYLNKLINKMNNRMIKVITGIRRCGKSFLLFNLFYQYLLNHGISENQIITVALDDIANQELCNPNNLYKYITDKIQDKNVQYYVMIDEVQYAISDKEWKNHNDYLPLYGVLNGLLNHENVDVYVTGSNSKLLSTDVLTEFRGRGDEIHVAPLSFSEYFPAHGGNKYDAWRDYTYYGGLPHILEIKNEDEKTNYLVRLNNEIYLRDIAQRYKIKNSSGLEEIMKVVASGIGSLTNPQKIADTFKSSGQSDISMPTITDYLKYLQESFIISKADRYDVKGRKYINTPSKYYYCDIGLRNSLLNFRQYEITHIMENVIYNELIYRGYNVDVGVVEITVNENEKRVRKYLEVDFVANLGSKRYYIQSAFSIPDNEKMQQEQASLINIPDSFKKIIIVSEPTHIRNNDEGVTIMDIYDFLLNENSLNM